MGTEVEDGSPPPLPAKKLGPTKADAEVAAVDDLAEKGVSEPSSPVK